MSPGTPPGLFPLRRQPLEAPATFGQPLVAEPVVQPVLAMHPEFDRLRNDAIPAPVVRQRYGRALVLRRQRGHRVLEHGTIANHGALGRRPSTQLTAERAAVEVGGRSLGGFLDHRARAPHLPPELRPVDDQRRPRILRQVAPFVAVVVGKEAETSLVDASQEHHPSRGLTGSGAGRDGHRLREDLTGGHRLLEPGSELFQRISVGAAFREDRQRLRYGSNPCDQRTLPSLSTGACCRAITQTPAFSSCVWASISSRSVLATRSQRLGLIDQPRVSIFERSTESLRRRYPSDSPSASTDALAGAESAVVP